MMRIIFAIVLGLGLLATTGARAQDNTVYVQFLAKRSLSEAIATARRFSESLPDVVAFAQGGTWYAISLGPYTRADAEDVLRVYRGERAIPSDSYLVNARQYGRQIWPIGQNLQTAPAPEPEPETPTAAAPEEPAAPETPPAPQSLDETPEEARQSEAALDRAGRDALQIALQWGGFYTGRIDGAFGRGTRRAMADWQTDNGFDPSGVLTTAQRAMLLGQYNAVLDGMNMTVVDLGEAGVRLPLPLGAVSLGETASPFVIFDPAGAVPEAQVFVISQRAEREAFDGLYDILQTLRIMPTEGPREKRANRFTIKGENLRIVSEGEARFENGEIKGFVLVWPAGDEERRTRVLREMRAGFQILPGALPPLDGGIEEGINLSEGLAPRQPLRTGSGFFVDPSGTVVTSAALIDGCGRVAIDGDISMQISAVQDGIATLGAADTIVPLAVAEVDTTAPRLRTVAAVAGYPFGGELAGPSIGFGQITALTGLDGEESVNRLNISTRAGSVGGPVVNTSGKVIGMVLPSGGEVALPDGVTLAASVDRLRSALQLSGTEAQQTSASADLDAFDIRQRAGDFTVLVTCWE